MPVLHSSNSSFVIETIAGGAGGSFSLGASNIGNTLGDTGVTGSRVVLAGIGNLTLSQATDGNGGTISISGGTAGGGGGVAISASNSLFSTGTVVLTGAGGGATVNTAAGSIQISVAAPVAQTVQTQDRFNLTLAGNTSGALALVSSGVLTLAGGNSITLSQNGNAITISGPTTSQSVQPETQTFVGGISASNTLYTSGSVRFTGSNIVTVRSGTGQLVVIDASSSQSVQTQNMVAVTLSGNTSGAQALISSGTMTLAGGNNITVSQNGNAVTISGPNVGGAQTGISGIVASDATYTSGTVTFTGSGSITVLSGTGQRVIISGSQSGTQFSAGLTNSGNTSGDTGTVGGRLLLVGTNNITLSGSTNGQSMTITMSGPTVGGAQTGISGIANSQTTYTSGTVSLSELGAITIRSTTGNQFQLSVNAQTAESQSFGMSNIGNTSGTTGIASGAQMRFLLAGGNNITLSQSLNGASGTITISAFNQSNQSEGWYALGNTTGQSSSTTLDARTISVRGDGIVSVGYSAGSLRISAPTQTVQTQGILSAGVSTGGNTLGNTQVSTGSRLVIVGSGMVTASQGTAAGASTITLNATQSVQSLGMYAVQNTTGQSSSTTMDARTLSVAGDGAVSVGYSAGSLRISAPTQTVQTQNLHNVTLSGNTAGVMAQISSGTMTLAGGNNITLSQNGNAVTISGGAGGGFSAGVSNVGNTSGQTGITGTRLVIAGGNNVTVSQGTDANGGTVTISAFTQSVESQSIGMSNVGNTAGTTGMASGGQVRFVFAGTNNITLSQSLNGASGTISISGAPSFSGGVSNLGNTGGATGISGTRLVLVGSNNVTLSQTTDASGATVSLFGQAPAGGAFSAGLSTLGNTSGSTGITGTQLVWAGGNNITLSQSTGANGGTVTVSAPNMSAISAVSPLSTSTNGSTISILGPATSSLVGTNGVSVSSNGSTISVMGETRTFFAPYDESPMVTGYQGQSTIHIVPMYIPNIQFDRILCGVQISNATNSSNSITLTQYVGIYTKNASTLSLLISTSTSYNFSGSGTVGSYSLYAGPRQLSIPWTTTLSGSDYYVAMNLRTTTGGGAGHSISQLLASKFTNSDWSGLLGAASTLSAQRLLGQGVYSAGSAGLPNSMAFTDIRGTNSLVLRSPIFHFRSGTV